MYPRRITTITDAVQIVNEWTEGWESAPTDNQIHQVARRLVTHVGGYGADLTEELAESFDLDATIQAAGY